MESPTYSNTIDFEDLIAQHLTPYSPVDLANLKPNKSVSTPRELEREA